MTIRVLMLEDRASGASTTYAKGSQYDLPEATAALFLHNRWATYVSGDMVPNDPVPVGAQIDPVTGRIRLKSSGNANVNAIGGVADDMSWLIPVHLPVLSPDRHTSLNSTNGVVTATYDATTKELGSGSIKFACSGAGGGSVRIALPVGAEYSNTAKVSARVHFRMRCDDWTKVTALHIGLTEGGGTSRYRQLRIINAGISRVGCTDPIYSAKWNGQWRTFIENSDRSDNIGSAAAWGQDTRYFTLDGLYFQITVSAACNIWVDRVYSPDWPVGFLTTIFDGAYKSARDIILPSYAARGWKAGFSINRGDGGTSGVTTYPALADVETMALAGHDVFMHGHYLSGASPTGMSNAVTDAQAREVLLAARAAIGGAIGKQGNRVGLRWHQWLQNNGDYIGTDMAGLLKSLGINAARGLCSDAEYGIDPANSTYTSLNAGSYPAPQTGATVCGWASSTGRFNRLFSEWFTGLATPEARDVFSGSPFEKSIRYAANNADGVLSYTHNILPYDGTNPTIYDVGTLFWRDALAEIDNQVAAGKLLVLSPTQLESITYWRQGDVYLAWDGEWRNRSDGSIAF